MYVNSYRDLDVYKLVRQLSMDVFSITKQFPREEIYSLTDQMRRSSRSIGGQIAEAWAKRKYINSFINKLTDADGEQLETQPWIETSINCEYISSEQGKELLDQYAIVGRQLHTMISKVNLFCKTSAK